METLNFYFRMFQFVCRNRLVSFVTLREKKEIKTTMKMKGRQFGRKEESESTRPARCTCAAVLRLPQRVGLGADERK